MSTSALDTLIDLTKDALDEAGRTLASNRRSQQQAQAQAQTLSQYRHEYGQRLQQAMQAGIDPASLQNYRAFLASLDQAIERATQTLAAQQRKVDNSQQLWQEQRRKLNSYDTLVERRAQTAQVIQQRVEQRHSDEISARLSRGANAFSTSPDRSL